MLKNIIIWIFAIGKIIWESDKFFSRQQFEKNLSENWHFVIFSLVVVIILYLLHKHFFPRNKNELLKSFYWIILITTISASCQNELGKDITYFHFSILSITIFYCIYIHQKFHPKKESLIILKIIIILLVVFEILWPPFTYIWTYWPRKEKEYYKHLFDYWFDIYL